METPNSEKPKLRQESNEMVKESRPGLRIALVRGASDNYREADPEILAAGGPRVKKFEIPFAGHSLKKILIARYVVLDAISWAIAGTNGN